MVARRSHWVGTVWLLALLLPLATVAAERAEWDQARVTALASELHDGMKGLRDEIRGQTRDIATTQASAYYRLRDNLRLIERESRFLHQSLESGTSREETLPTYARIAMLRRDCAEEMRRLFLMAPALERIALTRSIIEQMDPYYGFDPKRPDHERVIRRKR